MARVRYLGHEQVTVPELGRTVEPDEIVDIPDERWEGYVCQPANWEPIEDPKPADEPEAPAPKKTAAKTAQKEG
ncbi:hypothetical protein ACIQVK_03845 [Streptomyces sp. NPDC090493]|uniref:hypothetical protein n=1 Tax=Streptomyces sp. NPDC090493 TaxID=3365964 RepID=UPI0037F5B8A9